MSNNMVIKKHFSATFGGIFLLLWLILSIIFSKNIMDSNYSQSLQNALLQIDSVLLLSIIIFLTIVLNKKGEDFKLSAYRLRIESMGIAVLFIASASSLYKGIPVISTISNIEFSGIRRCNSFKSIILLS